VKKYEKQLKEWIETLPPDDQFDMGADNGIFFISYEDWRDTFSTLFVNIDFPEDWTGIRFKSRWNKSSSPGLPTTYTPDMLRKYAENP